MSSNPPITQRATYCERWNHKQRTPIHPLDEHAARHRHETGRLYSVVLGDHAAPTVVEAFLDEGYVGVRWLEPHGRDVLRYAFRVVAGRLFLSEVTLNTVSSEGRVVVGESTLATPEGGVEVSRFDNVERTVQVSPTTTGHDVSALWEDIPAFGDYASIIRRER